MKRRSPIAALSKTTPKINIAQAYLQLQRLRQLVQEAERSLVPHGPTIPPSGSRINLRDRHQA
jgi:hypothetical protein